MVSIRNKTKSHLIGAKKDHLEDTQEIVSKEEELLLILSLLSNLTPRYLPSRPATLC